jgi:ABC-type multidrug transport system ATPase subunit/ABC-type multidrug transport system permease subunit
LGGAKIGGEVYFDGDNIKSNKFLVGKVADYIEQGDTHEAVLTVAESILFSWLCTTAGHHSYARARDDQAAAVLNKDDEKQVLAQNVMMALGIHSCKDTLVGNGMIRGVSGGQKRRVTVGEMLVCPRPVKLMDSISNGLDSATTYDIVRSIHTISINYGTTVVISLLQPPPDVYKLFDEIILLSEGRIFYQGPRESVMSYLQSLGYTCPSQVDEADFLQELPTPAGKRFITSPGAPHSSKELANAWKESQLFQQLLSEMKYLSLDDAKMSEKNNTKLWFRDQSQEYAGSFWFYFMLLVDRQFKIVVRDGTYIKARIIQTLLVGAISGSLFNNISVTDVSIMNGFLYNTLLFTALGSFAILPLVYAQKAVYYKQKDAQFYPTSAFCLAQSISMFPLQLAESICYVTVVYWSAGLAEDFRGSRFLTFIVVSLMFSMAIGQMFRVIAASVSDMRRAMPIGGIINIIMLLFSGFIQPKSLISDGWSWFYWINPIAWALKAVTINEFSSPKYDFQTCTNPSCSTTTRFGDYVLEQYGNPTDPNYIWYSVAVLAAQYLFLFTITVATLKYVRTEPTPPAPVRDPEDEDVMSAPDTVPDDIESGQRSSNKANLELPTFLPPIMSEEASQSSNGSNRLVKAQLPFDPICFAFKDILYTVTLPNGEDVDLLQNVNGYFEPGTVTALMGSSGAGKTTLLDVLAGRKNTGVVKGEMYLNGMPKIEAYFRKIMGYVEQFDTLPQKSTAREAVAFSAALRLAPNITAEAREIWVNAVLHMMDLEPIENNLIGDMAAGGMSFEQRKRVSIAVELAANPSILFLDEPTTGLDSRASLALIKNIRTIAASGRSVVCTIHQPSTAIFNAFDQLLLLRRGGQTVFFGPLGTDSQNLVEFFEMAPNVVPIGLNVNPATWMLDIIGAGTSASSIQQTDFRAYYLASTLCSVNDVHLEALTKPNEGSRRLTDADIADLTNPNQTGYNASYFQQFRYLMHRITLTYWRSPSYSLFRHFTNILIALIFASAYPLQTYHTYVATVSRAAVIYITSVFCGVLSLLGVVPVLSAERPAFYREQQSQMYSVFVYCLTLFLIEIPYLLTTSLSFTLPFFFLVGFDNVGNTTHKFFWMWLFNFLWQSTMLFLGEFYVSLTPSQAATQILGSMTNTIFGLFCGFLIGQQDYPTFWLFMYWLDPLHYALEGLITSQFHDDTSPITTMNGNTTTAENYIQDIQFPSWNYSSIGFDVLALCLFIVVAIVGNYLCLSYLRHDKR